MKGKFVTFEGCEGVGKSTQLRLLREELEARGIDAVYTREPGGTPVAEKIRKVILDPDNAAMDGLTELLLYAAARRQHTAELIERALDAGKLVFCDRYVDSTTAYQGYARGLDLGTIAALNRLAMGNVTIDLTIFLDVPPDEGFVRKGGADGDRLESEAPAFHRAVYEGFRKIADSEERVVSIRAAGTKYDTHAEIVRVLEQRGIL